MAADATTAMTIDFLRARLLSERSVSRAAKERADQLAKRVVELEEQLRTVTTQRRKAERAAAEVLAILETHGFGRLSDAADSGSDDDTGGPGAAESGSGGKGRGEEKDALSGSELEGTGAAPQAGGLSWKGRAASPDSERRQPHRGRQLRQRHNHSLMKSYFYLLTADSSPKYQPGQSCRKIKRKELRLQTEGDEGKDNATESPEEEQERSDCTVCTDEQHDLNGEVSQDARGSCGDGSVEDGNDRYTMEYQKNGEMERVLEKQAELIGQYEAEETAQREWERKFSGSRDSTVDDNKLNQNEKACKERGKAAQFMDREAVCEEARSSGSEMDVRKDGLVNKSYSDIDEGSGNILGRSAPSPQTNYKSSSNAVHNRGQGDGNSDSGSSYHANARSYEHYITTISVGSPLSDTPKSKISEWSSSCFHNHTDNQIDAQLYQPSNDDVGGVLEALQRAKMSLREKLSRPSPPSQDMLALPAPDCYTKDYLPVNDTELSLCVSRRFSQEILAQPASRNYLSRISLPWNDAKVPVGPAGLFRLPTDSFLQNKVCSTDGYGARFSLTAGQTSSVPQYGSGFSLNPYYDPHSSDCPTGDASFIPEILRSSNDSRRGMPSGDAGMLFQYGSAYN